MIASPTARINFAGAAEVVDSLHSLPITDTFVRAAEDDPRRTRAHRTTQGEDMTTTEAVTVDGATSPAGINAGAVTAAPTPISDRARDYLNLDSLFTAEELAHRDKVRAFVDARIRPNIARWYEDAVFAKLVIRSGMDADQSTGLVVERCAQALLYTTDDTAVGADAFLAKRRPVFQGR